MDVWTICLEREDVEIRCIYNTENRLLVMMSIAGERGDSERKNRERKTIHLCVHLSLSHEINTASLEQFGIHQDRVYTYTHHPLFLFVVGVFLLARQKHTSAILVCSESLTKRRRSSRVSSAK